jgi:hypothetical protein
MPLKLPEAALAQLEAARGFVDTKLKATRAQLVTTCQEHGYALHAAVVAFEASYGGLVIPEQPKQKKSDPVWLFGAHACLSSGAPSKSRAPRATPKTAASF